MKINPIKMLQLSAAALVLSAFAYGGVSAAEKKKEAAKRPPACNTLKDEKACEAREDCTWVAAVTDKKTGKEKRRAYCRAKPKALPRRRPEAPRSDSPLRHVSADDNAADAAHVGAMRRADVCYACDRRRSRAQTARPRSAG